MYRKNVLITAEDVSKPESSTCRRKWRLRIPAKEKKRERQREREEGTVLTTDVDSLMIGRWLETRVKRETRREPGGILVENSILFQDVRVVNRQFSARFF